MALGVAFLPASSTTMTCLSSLSPTSTSCRYAETTFSLYSSKPGTRSASFSPHSKLKIELTLLTQMALYVNLCEVKLRHHSIS